jgi:transposase InsO family protein
VAFVRQQRQEQSRVGARKLHLALLEQHPELRIGRDGLIEVLREHELLVRPRRAYARTTNSEHGLPVWENLLEGKLPIRVHQVWVSDITYVSTEEGFRYLALITDGYSRKIVGYDLSASLSIEGSLRALEQAIAQLPTGYRGLVHHSDRGVQYCSHAYVNRLRQAGISISMAETGNPYQNAKAERVNGILKQEFLLDERFASEAVARRAVDEAIWVYNNRRRHMSLAYRIPQQVHQGIPSVAVERARLSRASTGQAQDTPV